MATSPPLTYNSEIRAVVFEFYDSASIIIV